MINNKYLLKSEIIFYPAHKVFKMNQNATSNIFEAKINWPIVYYCPVLNDQTSEASSAIHNKRYLNYRHPQRILQGNGANNENLIIHLASLFLATTG